MSRRSLLLDRHTALTLLALRTGWSRRRLEVGVAEGHVVVENWGPFWKIAPGGTSANPWHVVIDRVCGCIVWSTLKSAALELRPRKQRRARCILTPMGVLVYRVTKK